MTVTQEQIDTAGLRVDADLRSTHALLVLATFLACEPMIRALLWWSLPTDWLRGLLHADTIWLQVGLLAVVGTCVMPPIRQLIHGYPWLVPLFLLWSLAAVASSVAAVRPEIAASSIWWTIPLAFALALLATLRRHPEQAVRLLMAWSVGFIGNALVLVAFISTTSPPPMFDWVWGMPGILNVRHLGFEAMAVALIGSLLRPTSSKSRAASWLLRFAAIAGWTVVFWSGGRGSFLAAVAALATIFMLCPTEDRRRRILEVAGLMLAGFGLAMLHVPPDPYFGAFRTLGLDTLLSGAGIKFSNGRFDIWRESLQFIMASPLLGIGENQMPFRLASAIGLYTQPHNILLQALLAWGIPGGVAFLTAIGFALRRAIGRVRAGAAIDSPAAAGLAIALALAANALLDGTLYHPRPVTHFLLGLCVALAAPRTAVRTP